MMHMAESSMRTFDSCTGEPLRERFFAFFSFFRSFFRFDERLSPSDDFDFTPSLSRRRRFSSRLLLSVSLSLEALHPCH